MKNIIILSYWMATVEFYQFWKIIFCRIMADPTLLRDIAIKTGVVKRLVKELCYYEKEEEKLMVKLQAIQGGDDADEHIVKKQIELLQVILRSFL